MTDWYKIKRWLIRVNWVEKQFYPAGYQYSYDFRNKTIQNLTDDWWTFSPSGSSSVYFDSNGMYCTTSSWKPIQHDIDLSNATKVTIESNCTLVSSRNYFLWIWTAYTEWNPNGTYMYFALNTTSIWILNTPAYTDYTKPTWWFTARIEIDFSAKTIASYIWDSQYYTQSLTDAQVTTMKSYNKLQLWTAVSWNYAVDISITAQ